MDACIDACMDACMDACIHAWMHGCMHVRLQKVAKVRKKSPKIIKISIFLRKSIIFLKNQSKFTKFRQHLQKSAKI